MTRLLGHQRLILWVLAGSILLACQAFTVADRVEAVCQPNLLDESQIEEYKRDGFIVLRDLLDENLVARLCETGEEVCQKKSAFPTFFAVMERGLIFNGGSTRNNDDGDTEDTVEKQRRAEATSVFREVALYSQIPQVVAELMALDPDRQNLRVLR